MKRNVLLGLVLASATAAAAAADEFVVPILAVNWPGHAGNVWNSELFLTNPGPTVVNVGVGKFLPGTVKVGVPCYPPIAAFTSVPPYSTVLVSRRTLWVDLQCPVAALGAMALDADGPVVISTRVVNDRGASTGELLSGFGQEVPGVAAADLAVPDAVYTVPGLVWDPFGCGPPAFESYLYLANAGGTDVDVTLQRSRDGTPAQLLVNGKLVVTPYVVTVGAGSFRQLKVDYAGPAPAGLACQPPMIVDLFFSASGPVAVVGSVVDRSSQDARTVIPVRTAD
jgi:hypothetical protein